MRQSNDRRTFIHRLSAGDEIVSVNDAWVAFAAENGAPGLSREAVVGKPLWGFIEGLDARSLWRALLSRVRGGESPLRAPYRCDSPDCRRSFEMSVRLQPRGEVEMASRVLRLEPRPPLPLLDAAASRSDQMVTLCSWCKKVDVGQGQWLEVEAAVARLDLLGPHPPPQVTHGMCDACRDRYGSE
ncbi:MAG: PAS domain-containing protein [Candidatus Brocadiia bacterium]